MNIIFGDAVKNIPDSFTVLELDQFTMSDGTVQSAYCVVEKIPLAEFGKAEAFKKVHADLIRYFREGQWTYCEHAIEGLMGKWNGELDSFYTNLLVRVLSFKENVPTGKMYWLLDRN